MTFDLLDLPTNNDLEIIANASREDIERELRKLLGAEYPNITTDNNTSWGEGTPFDNGSSHPTSTLQVSQQMLVDTSSQSSSISVANPSGIHPDQGNTHFAYPQDQPIEFNGPVTQSSAPDPDTYLASGMAGLPGDDVVGQWFDFSAFAPTENLDEINGGVYYPQTMSNYSGHSFTGGIAGPANAASLPGTMTDNYNNQCLLRGNKVSDQFTTVDPSFMWPQPTNEFVVGSSSTMHNVQASTDTAVNGINGGSDYLSRTDLVDPSLDFNTGNQSQASSSSAAPHNTAGASAPTWNPLFDNNNQACFSGAVSPAYSSSAPASDEGSFRDKGKKTMSSTSKESRRGDLPSNDSSNGKQKPVCQNIMENGELCNKRFADASSLTRHKKQTCKGLPTTNKPVKRITPYCPARCKAEPFSRPDALHRHLIEPRHGREVCYAAAVASNLGWDPKIPSTAKVFAVPDSPGD
ncbi:uncharacterized protein FOMMEDRAFT_159012 [Fomitiporia mediterranea MF3/22]|uniref:uncharacterized protein n=1 Tax=Fomitiporia mediterranea (strain MF3/22) TaxID=694068 RepID=UPI0004408FE4|nr:uncharacterized protein FOMMEDRAFT_159012 [Fomitiporia mediterranea MF3/22]EJD00339.1 hypothetical protein FOMMEDRAFT_159012 [Fomitiporia mediterranea MF3/22]